MMKIITKNKFNSLMIMVKQLGEAKASTIYTFPAVCLKKD